MLQYNDIKDWLSSLYMIGPNKFKYILSKTDITNFYYNYRNFDFLSDKQINEIVLSQTSDYIKILNDNKTKYNTRIISYLDDDYPRELRDIPDPPKSIFVRGKNIDNTKPKVAIIGSRNPSKYGMDVAYKLSYTLSKYCTIVSGLAMGIDCQAHIGALDAGNYTIGIIGCGVDIIYPRCNHKTFSRVYENGSVISEYNFGIEAKPWHFPARNRLISGFADVIIVVEALEQSGTSITVNSALDQGKDVMAVPGRINDKNSKGCLKLIQSGAYLLSSYKDVLDILNIEESSSINENSCNESLIKFLASPKSIFEIAEYLKLNLAECSAYILELEQKNMIKLILPGLYISNLSE